MQHFLFYTHNLFIAYNYTYTCNYIVYTFSFGIFIITFFINFSTSQIQADIPGPGTYGEGGVPWAVMERKSKKPVCMTGLMEGGIGHSWDNFQDKVHY